MLGRPRIAQRADHLVVGRQPRARDAVRHHFGIAEDRRAGLERGAGGGDEAGREDEMPGGLDQAAGVDHAHGDIGLVRREARQVGLGADDGEGALVDRRAIPDVVGAEHRHACLKVCATSGPSLRKQAAASSPGSFSARSSVATRPIAAAASFFATSAIGCSPWASRTRPARPPGRAESPRHGLIWRNACRSRRRGDRSRGPASAPRRQSRMRWRGQRSGPTRRPASRGRRRWNGEGRRDRR